jgi:hypothetical protein
MKKYVLTVASLALLLGGPVFADEMAMKHDSAMCTKHCNIMDLEKKVNALKAQQSSADKTATKEHLKKDIETYEKKLEQLKTELDEAK